MSAHADDLRYFYSEHLGNAQVLAASGVAASITLEPGRYWLRYRSLAGAATVWLKQGLAGVVATASAPSTPFDFALLTQGHIMRFMVRKGDEGANVISAITNAGTVDLVFIKTSRDKQ